MLPPSASETRSKLIIVNECLGLGARARRWILGHGHRRLIAMRRLIGIDVHARRALLLLRLFLKRHLIVGRRHILLVREVHPLLLTRSRMPLGLSASMCARIHRIDRRRVTETKACGPGRAGVVLVVLAQHASAPACSDLFVV